MIVPRPVKLVTADLRSKHDGSQWIVGEWRAPRLPEGATPSLCGHSVFHAYASAEGAAMYNPIHGDYADSSRLFEIEAERPKSVISDGLKLGYPCRVRIVHEIENVRFTVEERVAFAICASPHRTTREWAVGWLSGRDRSAFAARAAAGAVAWAAARAAGAEEFHHRAARARARSRAILAGTFPAERYAEDVMPEPDR